MGAQHILLVEDDQELARLVADYLHSEAYTVVSCSNTLKAKKLLASQGFDLIICDVMLPGSSGFELVQQIRSQFKGPILFMTAQTTVASQLQGLELGAQDYLLKPIDPRLLLAKIRVFLPQPQQSVVVNPVLQHANLRIDKLAGQVVLAGEALSLTNAELQLLVILLEHFPLAVCRERLFREQLNREYDGADRTIDGRASRLRKKLQQVDPRWNIRNVWGQGYSISCASDTGEPT